MVDQITDDMFSEGSYISLSDNELSWLNKYAPKDFSDCPLKTDEKKLMSQWLEFLIKKSKEPTAQAKSSPSTKRKKINTAF